MPFLSEKDHSLLELINGDSGIVSTAGKIPHERGDFVSINPECEAFNLLSKVFFKGPEPTIYISVIYDCNTRKLFVSYPGKSSKRALTQEKVTRLFEKLSEVLTYDNIEAKIALFAEMYSYNNDIIMNKLIKQRKEELVKKRKGEPNEFDLINQLQPGLGMQLLWELLAQDGFKDLVERIFDSVLPQLDKIEKIEVKAVEVMPHTTGPDDKYYGIHVEAKGIHYARSQSPDTEEFSIGLARRDDKEPGCCAGCSSEFNAIEALGAIVVRRSGDFPYNFPPKNYTVSQNISEAELSTLVRFVDYITQKLIDTGLDEKVKDHEIWSDYTANADSGNDSTRSDEDGASLLGEL